jgi:hypothetical protein
VGCACSVTRRSALKPRDGLEVQLQAPTALSAWEEHQGPTGQEAGLGQGLVWMWRRRRKFCLCLWQIRCYLTCCCYYNKFLYNRRYNTPCWMW